MSGNQEKQPCVICQTIRYFVMAGVPLLLLMVSGAEFPALQGIRLTDLAGTFFGVAFVVVVAWKAWDEYWRK
jgi:membrane protein CcdC involved in cytochrome C biogenesis